MGAEGPQDHPYVAHYDEPDVPDVAETQRDAAALAQADGDSARQMDFARWRVPRSIAGLLLACVSIAGGAVAVMSVIAALTSGPGPVDLVTTIDASGAGSETLSAGQLYLLAGVLVALEVVLIWAATLLFSRRLHPGQWVAVGFMAAASTAAVVVALSAGGVSLGGTEWPYIVAFPLIVVASVLELLRIRRLRARWPDETMT
jgi:hypothetical protein